MIQIKMSFFQEVAVLLWCAVCVKAACSNETVCVTIQNGSETECQHYYPIVYKLSDLTANETGCKTVHIYLTSGTHILDRDLFLSDSVQETEIHGAPHGQPSIIECRNNSGIRFSENRSVNKILISNMMFLHCQRKYFVAQLNIITKYYVASLYLRNAMYALSGVTVNKTDVSLFSENCSKQIIFNCTFSSNISLRLSRHDSNVSITHSTFNSGAEISCYESNVCIVIQSSTFSHGRLNLQNVSDVKIRECLFVNNKLDAVLVHHLGHKMVISMSIFHNNSRAIYLIGGDNIINKQIRISECDFINHTGYAVITALNRLTVIVENSSFQGNKGPLDDSSCSILDIQSARNFTLSDVHIANNNCTGITIDDSKIFIQNSVNLIRNHGQLGGGLSIKDSVIVFAKSSKLSLLNNTADEFGGGAYVWTGKTMQCTSLSPLYFFRQSGKDNVTSELLVFSGNSAGKGGDAMFGGCLASCYTRVKEEEIMLNKCQCHNPFWNFVSSMNTFSQSTFVENQRRVMFCANTTSEDSSASGASCSNESDSLSVYRGQIFTVPLMVADDCCFPSSEFIEAELKHFGSAGESPLRFKHDIVQIGRKYCEKFSYTLIGGSGQQEMNITVTFRHKLYKYRPALLRVHLKDCPVGYEIDSHSGECSCKSILKSYKIECRTSNVSLQIPAHTWVGSRSGSIAVHNDCQYCKSEEVELIITRGSNLLCTANRAGVMCGACVAGHSLQLGGYECADCSNFTYKGALLLIAFAVIGIALVLLLLGLNLTVSTGMINGLIFYSNIVYLNSDALLPTTREGNSTHLQNTVRILSTFQAWVNLDFGIVTCFFDGYDTYISTWMQFVFPLYIWLLILIIVLASRYSSRISRITTSNTVSVLATLLLLSYAKLLNTSIEAFSSVKLQLLDGNMTRNWWKPDANIPYLGQLHLPLFLMSLVMVIVYVIPFTLLILLRPLLQGKSHYRVLKWIHRLKPFLDAFYGPYTSRYRYWPGILLLARVVILGTFAFYSPNDTPFRLLTVSLMATVLLVSWMVIGKINRISLNRTKYLNYLELFLLLNLAVFTALSIYTTKFSSNKIRNQQALAVVMVGTVLLLSCGILGYHVFVIISKYKAMRKLIELFPLNIIKQKSTAAELRNPTQKQEHINTTTTHTLVEIMGCDTPNDQLREPLMEN